MPDSIILCRMEESPTQLSPSNGHPTAMHRWNLLSDWMFGACALVVALRIGFRWRNIEADDNLIPLRYVRNLLEGNGWVYNIGERVNAATSALNTILITITAWVGNADPITASAVVFGSGLALAAIFTYFSFRAYGLAPAWFAGLLVLFMNLVPGAVGLEIAPYLGLIAATLWAYSQERFRLSAALLGLVFLERPDGLLLWILIFVHFLWRFCHEMAARRALLLQCAAIAIGVTIPWLLFSQFYFGAMLPDTVGVKIAQGQSGFWGRGWVYARGIRRWLPWLTLNPDKWFGWQLYAALGGVGAVLSLVRFQRHALLLIWAVGFTVAYSLLNVPAYHWYYNPLHFGILVMMGVVFAGAWTSVGVTKSKYRSTGLAVLVILGIFLLQPSFPELFKKVTPQWPHYRAAADWIRENTKPDDSVACAEIGVIGYYVGDHPIIDMSGLVTPGGTRKIAQGDLDWWFDSYTPQIVVAHDPLWPMERAVEDNPDFKSHYKLVHSIDEFEGKRLKIYSRMF